MSEYANSRKRLGDFELIRELGRVGTGIVYEARQVSLNRRVALKVISGGLAPSSKAVLRFQQEAETGGKLHHTNIVPICVTGNDDGAHDYAMEAAASPADPVPALFLPPECSDRVCFFDCNVGLLKCRA